VFPFPMVVKIFPLDNHPSIRFWILVGHAMAHSFITHNLGTTHFANLSWPHGTLERAFIQASSSTASKAYLPIGAASSKTCKSYRRQRDNHHYYIPLPAIARSDWRHWYCHIVVWHGDIQRYACLGWEHIYNSPSYITRMIRK